MVDSDIINCCREYQKKKGNHSITDDYFYFMYPYSILIKNKLNFIFSKYSLDYIYNVDNLINDIVYQIVAYAKPQLFNYIILYEYEISEKEDLLEGNTNEEKLSWFIKELSNTEEWIEYCFEKYPVFTRILDKFTNNTLHYIEELISNFTQDFNDLHKLKINSKSRLNKITLFTGDLHNGRSVAFFEFANNVKLVYKPRCANNEIAFMEICSLLRSEGCLINVGIPKFLNRKNHTWYEFIKIEDISTIDELPAYYLNLGKLLCIFFVLGTNDIIPDNVISTGGIPYLIDLEVLMSKPKSFTIYPEINYHFEASVIKTGILPVWMLSGINERNNISSLLFPYKNGGQTFYDHLPRLKGIHYHMTPELLEYFTCGFKDTYHFFYNNKEKIFDQIENLSSLKCSVNRIILHPTSIYSMLFNEMTIPECLNGKLTLRSLLRNIIKPEMYKELGNIDLLIESIINQLLNCDIPYFFVKKTDDALYDAYGTIVLDKFAFNNEVGCKRVQEQLSVLSDEDLKLQLAIINSTITLAFEHFHWNSNENKDIIDFNIKESSKSDYLRTAIIIGDKLFDTKIQIGNEINWIGKNRSELDGKYETMPMNQNLYDGNIGIALFFIYLSKYTNNKKYIDLSVKIFQNVKKNFYELENIGYYDDLIVQLKKYQSISPFNFPMSLLYLMEHLPFAFYDEKMKDAIFLQISKFMTVTEGYDYFSGLAGFVDYLITDKISTENWKYQKLLDGAIASLMRKGIKEKNMFKWIFKDPFDGFREMELGGFAHGSAANAYVLARLFEDSRKDIYYQIARMALNHDRSFYSESIEGWRDGRVSDITSEYDGGSWCHGASGIALSRLLLINSKVKDEKMNKELEIASSVIKKNIGFNQCICHGDMGNLEVLYAVGKYLNNNELVKHSLTQANKISDQINSGKLVTCGDDHIEQLNGLFMGVAGVGYQFLRLLYWNDMPSILCLEWGRNNNKILH